MRFDQRHARAYSALALASLVTVFVAAQVVTVPVSPNDPDRDRGGRGDAAMFADVLDRVRAGEPYYRAMGDELRREGYPSGSIFNWRAPALYVALAAIPGWLSLPLLGTLALVLLASFMIPLARHGSPEGAVIGLGVSAAAVGTLVDSQGLVLTDAWSGLLIGLSLAAYLWAAWVPAAVLGLASLFVRELAAPFCVVCLLIAARARRRWEVAVWIGGLLAYGAYYGAHVLQIRAHLLPEDLPHPTSWVQFGGFPFWLATLKVNRALFTAPRPILAAAGVLLVSALWAPSVLAQVRWSVIAYGLFFCLAGQAFNDYWGFVPIFVYALALAHGPEGLALLVRRTRAPIVAPTPARNP